MWWFSSTLRMLDPPTSTKNKHEIKVNPFSKAFAPSSAGETHALHRVYCICKVGATKVEASFNIPKGICVNHLYIYISTYEYHSCSRVRKTMPEVSQEILLLRETGMVQHRPAKMLKMWWFSSTLRLPDPLTLTSTYMKSKLAPFPRSSLHLLLERHMPCTGYICMVSGIKV